MNWAMKIIPIVALAVVAAAPATAKTKHVRHHAAHYRVAPNAYAYNPADPPQRPVYSSDGRLIGRADDPNIRLRLQQDDLLNHGW